MKFQEIIDLWEEDKNYDDTDIDYELKELPKLHQKYHTFLIEYRVKLKRRQQELNVIECELLHYYRGRSDKPYNIRITSSSEAMTYIKADKKYIEAESNLEMVKIAVDTIREILDQLKSRHFALKAHIDWHKFTSGVG